MRRAGAVPERGESSIMLWQAGEGYGCVAEEKNQGDVARGRALAAAKNGFNALEYSTATVGPGGVHGLCVP